MDIEKHKAFAQSVAAMMREHDAYATDITYRLRGEGVFEQGRVTYQCGRHGSPGALNVVVTTHIGNFAEIPTPTEER